MTVGFSSVSYCSVAVTSNSQIPHTPFLLGAGDELCGVVRAGARENELLKESLASPNESPPVEGGWLGEENKSGLKSSGCFFVSSISARVLTHAHKYAQRWREIRSDRAVL